LFSLVYYHHYSTIIDIGVITKEYKNEQ
jgi:hypothetical protein